MAHISKITNDRNKQISDSKSKHLEGTTQLRKDSSCTITYMHKEMCRSFIYPRTTLTQAPNTAMQICRNKGATKKVPRKTVYDNVFKGLAKKVTFIQKIVVPLKQSISHESVHCYQCFSLWKMLDGECLVHDKEKLCVKTHFVLQKMLYFLK